MSKGLAMKSSAPNFKVCSSASLSEVSTITGTRHRASSMARRFKNSMPSMRGMRMSSSTMAMRPGWARSVSSASTPSRAMSTS